MSCPWALAAGRFPSQQKLLYQMFKNKLNPEHKLRLSHCVEWGNVRIVCGQLHRWEIMVLSGNVIGKHALGADVKRPSCHLVSLNKEITKIIRNNFWNNKWCKWSCLLRMDSLWRLCNTHRLFTLETILIGYHSLNYVNECDLNCSVQGRVCSWRTCFWTSPNINSNPKILLFSYWFFMQIGWLGSIGHLWTLSRRCSMLQIKIGSVQKLVLELETRPRIEPFRIHVNEQWVLRNSHCQAIPQQVWSMQRKILKWMFWPPCFLSPFNQIPATSVQQFLGH